MNKIQLKKYYLNILTTFNILYNFKNKQLILSSNKRNYIILQLHYTTLYVNNNKLYLLELLTRIFNQLVILKMLLKQSLYTFKYYITLNALGFRITNESYLNINILKLKIGFTHFIWLPLNPVITFVQGLENRFSISSSDISIISNLAYYIYQLKPLDSYKGRGIWIKSKFPKLKNKRKTT